MHPIPRKPLAILSCLFLTTVVHASSHLIIFGDSLSDAGMNRPGQDSGNNTWTITQGKTGAPITSLDPTTHTHPLWINWLATYTWGETLYPWRILQEQHLDPATHTVSYAYASAETGNHYLNDLVENAPPVVDAVCSAPGLITPGQLACVPGVLKQIDLYLAAVPHPSPDTIFYIWAGSNDIFNNVARIMEVLPGRKNTLTSSQLLGALKISLATRKLPGKIKFPTFSFPLLNLLQAKDRLVAAGVNPQQIFFINMPDLSETPAAIHMAHGNPVILGAIRSMSILFNLGLTQVLALNPFNKHNLKLWQIVPASDILNEIRNDADAYGLHNISGSCAADGKAPLCEGYLFFNDKHPTVVTGHEFAKAIEMYQP